MKRIAVLVEQKYEELEVWYPVYRLREAGYRLVDAEESWHRFSDLRAGYAGDLNSMARYWAVPPAQWVGDRSPMPHEPA